MKNSFRHRTALYTAPGNGSNDDEVKTVRSKVIENLIFSGENSRISLSRATENIIILRWLPSHRNVIT